MKILVVDLEENLPPVLAMLVQAPGNEVQSARTGDEALEITQGQQVDLLITEVILEPMNGFTLRNKMENRHPGVRTIFLTGYDLSPYAEYTAGYEVVNKPATPQTLFPAIARTLGFGVAGQPSAPVAAAPVTPLPRSAVATAVAAPRATPMPVPRAVPAAPARPKAAAPLPTPTPRATPAPGPRPVAVARAVPGAPRAVARPVAAAADPLLGRTLGAYRVERRLGNGKWGPVYMAIQTSVHRPVAMEILSADVAGDQAARENFVATARAKAAVQHPHILSVYEADQADGYYFYTHEYVDGLTLAQLAERGEGLSEPTALQTIKCVSQGLAHLHQHQISHVAPDAHDIYIGADGVPYLSNVAQPVDNIPGVQEEIAALAELIRGVLPGGVAQDHGLEAMLKRMAVTTQMGFNSWAALLRAIQAIEPKVIPADAFKLSAQDEAAIRAVEEARRRQRRQMLMSVAALVLFLAALAVVIYWEFLKPSAHDYSDDMVKIEGGPFIYQDGQQLNLPTFYIDRYEVTLAEYKKFLDYLAQHNSTTQYDSPLQPVGRSHVPRNWDIYYGRASAAYSGWRTITGVPISLDCPVFNVDYFDAYAYAKWKGRRLPTEQEWEKAARGPSGNIYPWGNQWDPKKLNAGGDYQPQPPPDYKPAVDGYTWWAPVDAFPTDRSPYGVIGMGGNVSEWTDTWDASKTYVTIRGGNYKSTADQAKTTASIKRYPEVVAEDLGFRTASDTPPPK